MLHTLQKTLLYYQAGDTRAMRLLVFVLTDIRTWLSQQKKSQIPKYKGRASYWKQGFFLGLS